MKINDLAPCTELRPYIGRYWIWDGERELPTMLPGTGGELIFQYSGSIKTRLDNGDIKRLSSSVVLSPRCQQFPLLADEPIGFLSIRFRTGALRHFCPIPSGELVDQYLSATDIWGPPGRIVEEQVFEGKTHAARLAVVERFLLTQLQQCKETKHAWLDDAFCQLYYRQEKSLDSVIRHSGVSTRYFQKVFKRYAKVSPTYFRRVARMEIVMRQLLLRGQSRYLDLALDSGFYDQAHFIKDFKSFVGEAPSRFLHEDNFRTHFYNPSLYR